jgi:NAD+ kinase
MNIQIVGILLRPSSPELKGLLFDVMRSFEAYGVEVMVDSISAGQVGIFGQDFEHLCQKCDLIVTVGGDGTLISGVRRSYPCGLPVVGIHAGTFGFLADIEPEQTDRFVEELLADQVRIDTRIMLEATLYSKDEKTDFIITLLIDNKTFA